MTRTRKGRIRFPHKARWISSWWAQTIIMIAGLAGYWFVQTGFVIKQYKIPTEASSPTIKKGDTIEVLRWGWSSRIGPGRGWPSWKKPERGQLIVFYFPKNPKIKYVKRVIGLPGDFVEMKDKVVSLNGIPLQEPYAVHTKPETIQSRDSFLRRQVPEGQYFLMGDNRDQSEDSRFWGYLPDQNIIGLVVQVKRAGCKRWEELMVPSPGLYDPPSVLVTP